MSGLAAIFVAVGIAFLFLAFNAYIVTLIWNALIVGLFHLPQINLLQGIALCIITSILFGRSYTISNK